MSAVGMPYAVALALVVALFDLIPLVGSTFGAAVVVLVALSIDPIKAVMLAGFFLVYQQIENNIPQPLVYGRSIRLHALAIVLAVLAGGQLLGILGAAGDPHGGDHPHSRSELAGQPCPGDRWPAA